jgi:DNA-binding transcriptional LysR family regulator
LEVDAEDVRYFHLLAQVGTLVRAAEELDVDHTTVSRRVQRLERALGTRLFSRTRSGWAINSHGERLLPAARMVALGIDAFTSGGSAAGGPEEWRILSPDGFAASVLTPHSAQAIATQKVILHIVSAPSLASRTGSSFDVAIVRSRPASALVRSRPLADYEIGLYARKDYLAQSPLIREIDDLHGHVLAWYADDPIANIPEYEALRPKLPQNIQIQSNNLNVHEQAAESGVGLAIMPTYSAERNNSLVRILPEEIKYHGRYWTAVPTTQLRTKTTERVLRFLDEAVADAGLTNFHK